MIDRSTPPKVKPIGDLKLPPMHTETLSNGLEFNWIDSGSVEANTFIMLWDGGPVEFAKPEAVMAMTQMLKEGTRSMSTSQLSDMIDYYGAIMQSRTQYHHSGVGVSTINKFTPDMLKLMRQMMVEPSFPASPFERYKQVTAQQIEIERAKVMTINNQSLSRLIMGADNPNVPPLNPQAVEALTIDDVDYVYRKIVGHKSARAYMCGKLDKWLLDSARSILETLPVQGEGVVKQLHRFTPQAPQTVFVEMPNALQSAVSMAIPAPLRSDSDYLPLRFAVMALGGYFGSRLMRNIREDKGYTYGINASLVGHPDGSYININAQTDSAYVDLLIEETKRELEKMTTELLDADELTRVCQYVASTCLETLDSPFTVMNYYFTKETVGMGDDYFAEQVRLVKEIDAETIRRMAEKYFLPSELRISVAGSK